MDNNLNSNLTSIAQNGLPSCKSIMTSAKAVLRNTRLVRPIMITCGLMIFQRFTGEFCIHNLRKKLAFKNILQAQILLAFML